MKDTEANEALRAARAMSAAIGKIFPTDAFPWKNTGDMPEKLDLERVGAILVDIPQKDRAGQKERQIPGRLAAIFRG